MKKLLVITVGAITLSSIGAVAGDKDAKAPSEKQTLVAANAAAVPNIGEQVNVESIKEKYWARGDESEMGVVQNRLYSKEKKVEMQVFGNVLSTDPFLSVKAMGAAVGFHFSEYLGVGLIGWKNFVSPSAARITLEEGQKKANTNEPRSYYGSELTASILYGKLSLVGKKILYYDMHMLAGLGATSTESGTYFTPSIGIGQQVFLSQWMSIRCDYRMMRYTETILEKEIPTKLGQPVGDRTNWTHSVMLGVDILFGGGV